LIVVKPATVPPDNQQELDHILGPIGLDVQVCTFDLAHESGEHWPRTRANEHFLLSARSVILFFALVTSCCHSYTSPASIAAVIEDGLGYSGIAIVGRLKSLIAFVITGPPL
jgi:hypothetical protein